MALDLLVLEEEIRQGRLSFNDTLDENFRLFDFNEGYLIFDGENYGDDLPEGYCLYYGLNQDKEATYFVKAVDLLKAEGSRKWADVCIHTRAREDGGMEVRRVSDKIRKVDIENTGRKLSKKEWERLKYKDVARFSKEEWEAIRNYAVPVKRAKRLDKLVKEVKDYTHNAIAELADYFDVSYVKLPEVKLDIGKRSRYNPLKKEIILGKLQPETIYHEAGHYLHLHATPEITDLDKTNPLSFLDWLFLRAIEEAIAVYCEKLGSKEPNGARADYNTDSISSRASRNKKIVDHIMEMNLGWETASKLFQDIAVNNFFFDVYCHILDSRNFELLSYDLGIAFGNYLWEGKQKFAIRQLMTSKETEYIALFFNTKRLVKGMKRLEADIRRKNKGEGKLITKK